MVPSPDTARRWHVSPPSPTKSDILIICPTLNKQMLMSGCVSKAYTAQGGPGTDITDAIPSLDMRPVLALFSPEDAFLRIESCTGCGGHLEIVTKETKRVARLTKRIRYPYQIGEIGST